MRRNLVFKILVIVGGILSVTSLFLPVGFFDGSKYKVENSYLPHLLKSDPLLSWLVVICSAALILLCIGSFFVNKNSFHMFLKVFGVMGSLFIGGLAVFGIFYVNGLKNFFGDKPNIYFGVWLLISSALLIFISSIAIKSQVED